MEKSNEKEEHVASAHKKSWKWAKEQSLFECSNPTGAITCQQAATVF